MPKNFGLILAGVLTLSLLPTAAGADDTGFAGMHDLQRERGKLCMSGHYHYGSSGSHKTKARAKRAAIASWQDFTDFEYGSDWARFSRAASRGMECSRSGGSWSCSVSARPCSTRRRR